MNWKVILILITLNVIYLLLGGVVFHYLESENEETVKEDTRIFQEDFMLNHTCLDRETLDQLIQQIITAYQRGGLVVSHNASNENDFENWDFINSVFFSATVVTTIGYGHMSPVTHAGQMVCLLYAVIGVPMAFLLIAGLAEKFMAFNTYVHSKVNICPKRPAFSHVIRVAVLSVAGTTLFILLPAAMFPTQEKWTYPESFYYVFISLSTIGFGDYVAGRNPDTKDVHGFYKTCICVWIMFGLGWLASIIATMQKVLRTSLTIAERKVTDKIPRRNSEMFHLSSYGEKQDFKMPFSDIDISVVNIKERTYLEFANNTPVVQDADAQQVKDYKFNLQIPKTLDSIKEDHTKL